jgi:hypothetical protein
MGSRGTSVEGGGTTDDTVDLVALAEEELGEIGAVLTGDTCATE